MSFTSPVTVRMIESGPYAGRWGVFNNGTLYPATDTTNKAHAEIQAKQIRKNLRTLKEFENKGPINPSTRPYHTQ